MKDLLNQLLAQLTPLLLCAAWYLVAGAIGSILGKWTTIESWVIANPKRALVYQILRATGLDFKKLLTSFRAFAEARSAFPPVIEVKASTSIVPDVGVIKTEMTKRVTVTPLVASLLVLLTVSGCAGTFEESRMAGVTARKASPPATVSTPARCQSLSERQYWFTGLGLASGAIGAAAGGMTIPIESKTVDTVLIVTTVAGGVGAAGLGWFGTAAGADYVRECQ